MAEIDSACYLDLGDDTWQAVKVTPGGWELVDEPEVHFRRPKGMLPIPVPEKGGSAELLKQFLNILADEFLLFLAWVSCSALRTSGRSGCYNISGIHGSAKSTLTMVARRLIDNYTSLMRSPPKDTRDWPWRRPTT